ncbi:MAG: response regulator [Prolixibacteraceae bacterium]|nr:response regulator [Prolixibacteraceae bacterium]
MNSSGKYTILYVDDEESNLRIFKNTFRRDYNILTATSGVEGLKLLDNEHVDLILTDQRMPGMTGVDFLKKAIHKYPELNRILVTAYSDYDILRHAVNELKIFQYVEKPWKQDDIKVTIDSALEIHRLRIENQRLTSTLMQNNNELKRINEELSREIEKHKITQIELIREKNYAESCNKLKSAFLANMSHEVRTPMNSIKGFIEIVGDDNLDNQTKSKYLGIINNSCDQLLHIMNDIIEISKIDSGNIDLKSEMFSINDLLNRVYDHCTPRNSNIEFKVSSYLPDEHAQTYADLIKLELIFSNLLDNAIKFTQKGTISFGAELMPTEIKFFVKDTGIGIANENFELIFDRFSQVDFATNRKYGGNGLGLAISKAYIEKMGGRIWVESMLGEGATFYFTLPRFI